MKITIPKDSGTIYFIRVDGKNQIKIGWTTHGHHKKRLTSLQTGNPEKLILLAISENQKKEKEQELHKKFSHLRIRNEWFELTEELLEYMKRNSVRVW